MEQLFNFVFVWKLMERLSYNYAVFIVHELNFAVEQNFEFDKFDKKRLFKLTL